LEGVHAQMVLHNIYLDKLNVSLKGKEKKVAKKRNWLKLFLDRKGHHLTNEAFIVMLEKYKADREGEDATKSQRKET
jgi:hypothetical protein